jgi:hypothetical protein
LLLLLLPPPPLPFFSALPKQIVAQGAHDNVATPRHVSHTTDTKEKEDFV